jgi:hypothetical protein
VTPVLESFTFARGIRLRSHVCAGGFGSAPGRCVGGGGNELLSLYDWAKVLVITILLASTLHILLERHRRS